MKSLIASVFLVFSALAFANGSSNPETLNLKVDLAFLSCHVENGAHGCRNQIGKGQNISVTISNSQRSSIPNGSQAFVGEQYQEKVQGLVEVWKTGTPEKLTYIVRLSVTKEGKRSLVGRIFLKDLNVTDTHTLKSEKIQLSENEFIMPEVYVGPQDADFSTLPDLRADITN